MIKQASYNDIPLIEEILLDAVNWMDSIGLHQWGAENVKWEKLSRFYKPEDFYVYYENSVPAACMAIIDYDPAFWPDIPKGESLFLHKIAVKRAFSGQMLSRKLLDYAKKKAAESGIQTLRLDSHADRKKVRNIYEKEGFVCVDEKLLFGVYKTAFYLYKVK